MVKLIVGLKGTGKTKALVEQVKKSVEEESGSVICLEKERNLTYDIPYTVRLIHITDYEFGSPEFFRGFISGLHAADYDISHIFIDGLMKMFTEPDLDKIAELLAELERRLGNDDATERAETVEQLRQIALLRLEQIV
mgnify:CR=1 FL=1